MLAAELVWLLVARTLVDAGFLARVLLTETPQGKPQTGSLLVRGFVDDDVRHGSVPSVLP